MPKIKLSIVIPCYNEAGNIPTLINQIKLISDNYIEIILVNNGSTDNTEEIISNNIDFKIPIVKVKSIMQNVGYGHGIMQGVRESKGEFIAWTHADHQTDIHDVIKAYNILVNKSNLKNIIIKGKRIGRNKFDSFFTMGMSLIVSLIMQMRFSDVNAQPKIFHKSFLSNLNNAPDDFSLDLFFLYKAKINNYSIIEFPVNFTDRYKGESKGGGSLYGKIRLVQRTLKYIVKLKLNI